MNEVSIHECDKATLVQFFPIIHSPHSMRIFKPPRRATTINHHNGLWNGCSPDWLTEKAADFDVFSVVPPTTKGGMALDNWAPFTVHPDFPSTHHHQHRLTVTTVVSCPPKLCAHHQETTAKPFTLRHRHHFCWLWVSGLYVKPCVKASFRFIFIFFLLLGHFPGTTNWADKGATFDRLLGGYGRSIAASSGHSSLNVCSLQLKVSKKAHIFWGVDVDVKCFTSQSASGCKWPN